jgi:hypothetical protein
MEIRTKDGHLVKIPWEPVYGSDGEPTGMFHISENITVEHVEPEQDEESQCLTLPTS